MEQLNLLGVALGLATLAGINLYLTVFVTGLAVNQHWITLAPQYQSLEVLGHPAIIIIAGILYFLEFFADKVPWIDSAWDAVHTVIRPIGGAMLGLQVLGHSTPAFDVIVALLAGSTTLVAHTAKASSRLAVNTSPEPFSNIGVSLFEDAAVFGGLALIYFNPLIALGIFAFALLAFLYFAPKVLRAMKVKIWLVFKKLNGPAETNLPGTLPTTLASHLQEPFARQNVLHETVAWALPCVSGRARRIPGNLFGALVATNEEPRKLVFVGRKGSRGFSQWLELDGMTVAREPKFLSENVVIFSESGKGPRYLFILPRSSGAQVEEAVEYLRARLAAPAAAIDPVEQLPAEPREQEPAIH
ncbi:hypothetical protein BH20VER2_BH20VER2_05270 [soil metagenome]|nr:DUF4126 domain-containing protein [Chthoniobacterales bacterium]